MGQRIREGNNKDWITIVGIVGNILMDGLAGKSYPQIFIPHLQFHQFNPLPFPMGLVIRGTGDPMALVPSARTILKNIDPEQAFYEIMPLEKRISRSLERFRANIILIGVSSVLALLLAFIGIYGVVSYVIGQRIPEFGVRMALGAQPLNVLRMILKQSLVNAVVGLLLGLAGAFILTRYISSMLYGVTTTDPEVFTVISFLVLAVALLAAYIPSRRATRIELSAALRNE